MCVCALVWRQCMVCKVWACVRVGGKAAVCAVCWVRCGHTASTVECRILSPMLQNMSVPWHDVLLLV